MSDTATTLRAILISQYHAALAMLRQAIEQCPDDLWRGEGYTSPFWKVAYHTLYFTHLYIQPKDVDFRAWEHHQTNIQYLDNEPAPPEIEDLLELPHRPPQTGEPYTKAELLEYWEICDAMVNDAVDAFDPLALESGIRWYKTSKLEHQFTALRHIQHHTAQLADRLRIQKNTGINWISSRPT